MGQTVIYMLIAQKLLNLKQKTLILLHSIMSWKHFKNWSIDNMKDNGLNGYVYDFSVDYDVTSVDDSKDIHKYLMKKNNIVWIHRA